MSKKLFIEAPEKNKGPILEVLKKVIPEKFGNKSPINVLEIGSGTGQHAVYFSKEMPNLKWFPSDIGKEYLESIRAHIEESQLSNVEDPVCLDIMKSDFNECDKPYDIMVAINFSHIVPWTHTEGLFKAAGHLLIPGGILVTYGPYSIHGEITPESNVKFNEHLKAENSEWGLKDIDDLEKQAKMNHLSFDAMFDMPSNNKTLIWLKQDE